MGMIFVLLTAIAIFFILIGFIGWQDQARQQHHITVYQPIIIEEKTLFPHDDFYSEVGQYLIDYMQEEWNQRQGNNTFQ